MNLLNYDMLNMFMYYKLPQYRVCVRLLLLLQSLHTKITQNKAKQTIEARQFVLQSECNAV